MALASLQTAPLELLPVGPEAYSGGEMWHSARYGLRVIVSIDAGWRHLSVSHPYRFPTWNEILRLRNWFFPSEMEVVMVLARRSEYVNVHPNCFHLWQSACGQEGR